MVRPVQKTSYNVLWDGHPALHEEVMWYATEDDRTLGVIIRDRVDDDYGWVILKRVEGGPWCAVDLDVSRPNAAVATSELFAEMRSMESR
jgi:hypothetical protein